MQSYKIFNDPVHGFIQIPKGILLEVIDHPYVQRLRRIKQLGMSDYVYPGATHTRFHHALGALHLMTHSLDLLKSKGVNISNEEKCAAQLAILLHDIGHGPYSHALEGLLIDLHHETVSLQIMKRLNKEFNGALSMAIAIFSDQYEKKFLHQLVSSQLDMDRMDYISRDAYYSGVVEGVIGYDRIIKMMNVIDDKLVIEEKGIYSIEKFLVARRLMYWQVYLHKTVISAEQMLISAIKRMKELLAVGQIQIQTPLHTLLSDSEPSTLDDFLKVDDYDIMQAIKLHCDHSDLVLNKLCTGIKDRKLYKIKLQSQPFTEDEILRLTFVVSEKLNVSQSEARLLVLTGSETNAMYKTQIDEIRIVSKSDGSKRLSDYLDMTVSAKEERKFFVCAPVRQH